jgi:phosphohistidine phosphatase SixA
MSTVIPVAAGRIGAPARATLRPELVLRIGAGLCFIGHGAFGVLTKTAWLPYFSFAGIGPDAAYALMPVIGMIDILVGIAVLAAPHPAFLLYMTLWAVWTAALRPLTGEPVWELFERAGNYCVPLALFVLAGGFAGWRARHGDDAIERLLRRAGAETRRSTERARTASAASGGELPVAASRTTKTATTAAMRRQAAIILRAATALLLFGHGALALLTRKPLLAEHIALAGLPAGALPVVGAFEIALAAIVAVRPVAPVLLFVLVWKVATELLFPLAGAPTWEFVERAGSYAAPLALLLLIARTGRPTLRTRRPLGRRSAIAGAASAIALVAAVTGAVLAPHAHAQEPEELVALLREGGYVLAFRHTRTDRSHQDDDVDYADRSTQRNLSDQGVRDARAIGAAIQALGIPIGDVITSPFFRTRETAEGAFAHVTVDDALSSRNGPSDRRRALFADPVPAGSNRVLVSHQGVLRTMIPELRGQTLDEGDIVVLRPAAEGTTVFVGMLRVADWAALAATQ